jgi:hypothetical protein
MRAVPHDDAPAFGGIVIVGLKKNTIVDRALPTWCPAVRKHGASLDDEVDWKDLGWLDARDDTLLTPRLPADPSFRLPRMVTGSTLII